jgi:photosystem II stability/assembly factor-like uncharacterized protein
MHNYTIRYFYFLIVLSLIVGCSINSKNEGNKLPEFYWQQSYLGGGGYITGLVQNPENPDLIFARCDVAGLFKSYDGGKKWNLVNKGLSHGYNHNTESVCISPHDVNIMFRASGEARNHTMVGEIHKSIDGGINWYSVTEEVDFFGNGPNRMYDERIAVDPFNAGFVAAGGYTKGVWVSHDVGENWIYSGLKHEPITSLKFHPYKEGILYVATLHEMRMQDYLFPDGSYDRPEVGRLYRTVDFGHTWELLFEQQGVGFTELGFFSDNTNKIIASTHIHRIIMSTDGGHSFKSANIGLPGNIRFNTVAVDPGNPWIVYTAPSRRGHDYEVPLVPIYKSTDGGNSWNILKDYGPDDFTEYPTYIRTKEHIGWAISKILVDKKDSSRLFMSNWYGVSVSNDGGNSWSGNNFQGTETVCIENLVVDYITDGRSGFVMPDHRPFIGENFGESYRQVAAVTEYKNSTVLVFSRFNPSHMLFAGKIDWMGEQGSAILLSRDNGKTFGVVKELRDYLTVQAIKEDPHTPGIFYAYIDRFIDKGAGLYKSVDWGETWTKMNLELPQHIKFLPHHMHFIENELLSVTFGQQKNVCGTNQLLCIDPHMEGVIYFGEWTEGLFRTKDGGDTWQDISAGLPFHRDTTSVIIDIKADESRPGVIYAGFIREGLWRSDDYGDSWEKVFPLEDRIFNASSIAIGGFNENEIVIASEPLFWSPSESAVYYSNDNGLSWKNIYDNNFGALRWKSIGIDPGNGTIYGVTCGNGAFYATRR